MDFFVIALSIIVILSIALPILVFLSTSEDEILNYKIKDDEIIFIMKSGTVYIQCLKTGKQRKI